MNLPTRDLPEAVFSSMLHATLREIGEGFLQTIVTRIARELGAEYVFVSHVDKHAPHHVRMVASASSQFPPHPSQLPASTDLAHTLTDDSCTRHASAADQRSPLAQRLRCQSFFALPLHTAEGDWLGHLGLLFAAPGTLSERLNEQLQLLCLRIESELARVATQNRLERASRKLKYQNRILKMAARHAPLPEVLSELILGIEAEHPGMLCSILQPQDEGRSLRLIAAPSLPDAYCSLLDQVPVGPDIGSCGAAASRGQRVIVEDIGQHPNWSRFRDLVLPHGLHSCWSQPVKDAEGQLLGVFAIYHRTPRYPSERDLELIESLADLSSLVLGHYHALDELHRRATTDDLTRLFNRASFMQALSSEFQRSMRHFRELSVLMFDLDHFKAINDCYGHAAGDAVLRAVAEACRSALRSEDLVARIGGEEFAAILPETSSRGAQEVAEKLRATIARLRLPQPRGGEIRVTCSVGVATLDGSERNHEELLSLADKALYQAKAGGRNQVCVELLFA